MSTLLTHTQDLGVLPLNISHMAKQPKQFVEGYTQLMGFIRATSTFRRLIPHYWAWCFKDSEGCALGVGSDDKTNGSVDVREVTEEAETAVANNKYSADTAEVDACSAATTATGAIGCNASTAMKATSVGGEEQEAKSDDVDSIIAEEESVNKDTVATPATATTPVPADISSAAQEFSPSDTAPSSFFDALSSPRKMLRRVRLQVE